MSEEMASALIDPAALIRIISNHIQNFRRYLNDFEISNDVNQLIRPRSSFNTTIDHFKHIEKGALLLTSSQLFVTFKTLIIHRTIELS
jgi:hypothetical protein